MDYQLFVKSVGERLKRRRKALGYTQSELVEILNKGCNQTDEDFLSDKQISRFESGHNCTRLDKFVKWSVALGKTPDYFLLGIDNTNEKNDKQIEQICEYLKVCDENDVNNVLLFVKAIYEKNNDKS